MRWFEAIVYKRAQVDVDGVKNPVYELQPTDTPILVRTAPISPRENSTEGNEFHIIERTFLTKAQKALVEDAVVLEIGSERYDIERIATWQDPIAIRVKQVKP